MLKPKCKIIISRYKENFDWVKEYTDDYLVYNKGVPIDGDFHILNVPNIGGNQIDIFRYIIDHYDNLPSLMAFIQANPRDHCKKEIFDKLIYNEKFTSLEYYGPEPSNGSEGRTLEGEFLEFNDNWYIAAHNSTYGLTCKYGSFDAFMMRHFSNYQHREWLRFCPGSQYLITKDQAKKYSLNFWKSMYNELPEKNMTEAHIIERALYYIFEGDLISYV